MLPCHEGRRCYCSCLMAFSYASHISVLSYAVQCWCWIYNRINMSVILTGQMIQQLLLVSPATIEYRCDCCRLRCTYRRVSVCVCTVYDCSVLQPRVARAGFSLCRLRCTYRRVSVCVCVLCTIVQCYSLGSHEPAFLFARLLSVWCLYFFVCNANCCFFGAMFYMFSFTFSS